MTLATESRDRAIALAERGVSEQWIENACALIRLVALSGQPFTSDSIRGKISEPAEPRAWGCAFKRCASAGFIKPTGNWRQSSNAKCHARPMREWVMA